MDKIAVLGSGMVGRTISVDLSRNNHEVHCFDKNIENLNIISNSYKDIIIHECDLTTINYEMLLKPYDLVVSAVPGFMGYKTLENIIKSKKNCVDISFFPEHYGPLHQLAIDNNVTVVIDCGVAPGMSNLILGRENEELKLINDFKFYVGGLPVERIYPFEYKAPFSPIDVIEEYIRPVRMRKEGIDIVDDALTEIEKIYVNGIGTLEGFNTDGLRSLLESFPNIPNMSEKTLRYQGYADKIKLLIDMGFFRDGHINNTSKVLIDSWKMKPGDKDLTYMMVEIFGIDENNKDQSIIYEMLDYHDGEFSSMSRTTAYTCTSIVELFLKNKNFKVGTYPPEEISKTKSNFDFILDYLKQRNVLWQKKYI